MDIVRCSVIPYEKALEALEILKKELPTCFKYGSKKVPLAVGIHQDVFAYYQNDQRFRKPILRKAIAIYTHGKKYLRKVVAGVLRIDLQGNPTAAVTQAEENHAKLMLQEKIHKKMKKQKSLMDKNG